MSRTLEFVKMQGTGNDFIMVDNRDGVLAEAEKSAVARALCPRRISVGADGLILLEPSESADVGMRIFNADGSEAEMCGNGARCLAMFAVEVGAAKGPRLVMRTMAGDVLAEVTGGAVRIELTRPREIVAHGRLERLDECGEVYFTNTGVPHAVVFSDELDETDVEACGRAIRFHREFSPAGANANFVSVVAPGRIRVRTYERGVEAETMACGTGSTAAALVAAWREGWSSPVDVEVRSGDKLRIHFEGSGPAFDAAFLEGPVKTVYRATAEIG